MQSLFVVLLLVAGAFALPFAEEVADERPLWARSGKWQGDIVLTPEQARGMRNGVIDGRYRWNDRTLPYRLRAGDFNDNQANIIRSSLEQYNTQTCVTVREANDWDSDFVLVTREDSGCWSYVGRLGGQQQLNLQDNAYGTCLITGTVVHEFLHAWGFYHEQSATNRDDYVRILWENISDGTSYNFDKYGSDFITDFGVEYDVESVMHYDKYAFSKNGLPTIEAIANPDQQLGNSWGMTGKDIQKLNLMYGC